MSDATIDTLRQSSALLRQRQARPAAILGAQQPTTRLVPPGAPDPSGAALARHLGMPLDPWQADIMTDAARRKAGRWSAFEACAIVPRQNGKSYLIVARALAGALLYDEQLILYSAHEYRTAQEVWRLIRDVCESEAMERHVKRIYYKSGGETIEFANGSRFKLIARTRSSGRGFSPDCLLLDEAFGISEDVLASILPSMSARPDPQVWYVSSAATWEALALLRLRQRGHNPASTRLAYWEWHAEAHDDIRDPRVWAKANPAYGNRITKASIQRELESMSKRAFQRERLGVWSESAVDSVLREDEVQALTVAIPAAPTDGRAVGWGLDVAWNRADAAIAACFRGDDGHPVVTLIDQRGGAGWVPWRLGDLTERHGADGIAFDSKGGITDLVERAERDHFVNPLPLRQAEYPAACAAFVQRVAEGTIRIAQAPGLIADANTASARQLTGGWVWQRQTATPPTALIAATCALFAWERSEGTSVGIY